MVALPEAGSGVRYRVARYVDIYVGEAENPTQAALEALANMDNATMEGERPILEVTDLETGEVTDVDLEKVSDEDEDDDAED